MTLEYIPKISLDKVYNLLPIDYREHTKSADIKEFDDTSKKELVRKRFYKLKLGESEKIHLTLGKDLKFVFDKTKSFYKECPKYACKPLFISTGQELDLLGQEFFEGTPIDEKYASNEISDEDVAKIVTKIQKTFSSLEVESTSEAFREEFNEFKETILSNNSLHLFDKDFLNKCVFPHLEDSLLPQFFSKRWSPGDLAARNILIDDNLNIRIIDCEFAHQTHFHDEDWIRLAVFSSGSFKATPSVEKRLERVKPWYHIYLWLRQTWLNRTIWQNDDYKHFASEDLYTVLKLTESFGTNNKNVSLLIHGVLEAAQISLNEISIENDIRIQKENELDAEKQLRLSKENELDAEKQLRLSKENELDAEKQLRLSKENELDAEKQLRLSKERELASEKELRLQKEDDLNCERQSRLSLENELMVKNDKIIRMQNSFSWRCTSPLRVLRRFREKNFHKFSFIKKKIKGATLSKKVPYPIIKKVNQDILTPLSPFELPDRFSKYRVANKVKKITSIKEKKLLWLIPDFGIGSGGHTTIFRMILWLESFGYTSKILICGQTHHGSAQNAKKLICEHFFKLKASVEVFTTTSILNGTEDIIISTSYDTCYYSRSIDSDSERFYFVQDYEPQFSPFGSYYLLAKDTYAFEFNCITAGKWLSKKVTSVGGKVLGHFELAVDKHIFFPNKNISKSQNNPPRIAVYSRSATPRRMTELAIMGLNILSKEGIKFEVNFFGDEKIPINASFPHNILGVVQPEALADLYRTSDIGCVFSGTNYSLVPLEMMACGLPIIEFDGNNTRETFPHASVRFTKPNPLEIAKNVKRLLLNANEREIQIFNALEYIKDLNWEKSARKLESLIKTIEI
jgi:glycosyltransferase involved in cell wall biosynthesis